MSQTSKAAAKAMRPAEPVEKIFSTEKSIAWKTGWVAWLWIAGAMESRQTPSRPKTLSSDCGRVRRQTVVTRRGCESGDQSARL
jgi:hypothetical protein